MKFLFMLELRSGRNSPKQKQPSGHDTNIIYRFVHNSITQKYNHP
jgi:hypothetical protein